MQQDKLLHGKLLRLGAWSFGIAASGVLLGFIGWYLVSSSAVAEIGFVLAVIGVFSGFGVIVFGASKFGRTAFFGSRSAKDDIRKRPM